MNTATAEKQNKIMYISQAENFSKIPGSPISYWATKSMVDIFASNPTIDTIAFPRQGLATGNNEYYLKEWFEVRVSDISFHSNSQDEFVLSRKTYIPYNKGGSYRKWYGNLEYVIKFSSRYYNQLGNVGNHLPSRELYFKESITWSKVTSGGLSLRYNPVGSAFDVAGCSIFASKTLLKYLLALCNSNIMQSLIRVLSQTLNYEVGTIKAMPVVLSQAYENEICRLSDKTIELGKKDWDSYETSWDFKRHPLI